MWVATIIGITSSPQAAIRALQAGGLRFHIVESLYTVGAFVLWGGVALAPMDVVAVVSRMLLGRCAAIADILSAKLASLLKLELAPVRAARGRSNKLSPITERQA